VARRCWTRLRAGFIGLVLLLFLAPPHSPGTAADRLERFRELARTRLAEAEAAGGEQAQSLYREIYALLDGEIVESLDSGSVFASEGFLQDRLDAFNEAWGGAALQVSKVGPLVVGAFRLGDASAANSVRVYGSPRGEGRLLGSLHREANPTLHPLPAARGKSQLLVAWEAPRSGRGTTPVWVDLIRQEGDGIGIAWSTADLFGGPVQTWQYAVHGAEVALRYELQYPGWVPGCEAQTEQEDLYRYAPSRQTFVRVRRQLHAAWHREAHAAIDRFFAALRADNAAVLRELVPDARLRARLPAGLALEPACDATEGTPPATLSLAAAVGPERRPWTLTFRRAGAAWRLVAAAPVIH